MRRLTPFLERRRRDFVLGGAVRDAGGLAGAAVEAAGFGDAGCGHCGDGLAGAAVEAAGFGDAGGGHCEDGLAGAGVEAAGFGDTAGNSLFQRQRTAAARRLRMYLNISELENEVKAKQFWRGWLVYRVR